MHLDILKKLIHSTAFLTSYIPIEILTVYTTRFYVTMFSYFQNSAYLLTTDTVVE